MIVDYKLALYQPWLTCSKEICKRCTYCHKEKGDCLAPIATLHYEHRVMKEKLKGLGVCMNCLAGSIEPCTDCLGTGWNAGDALISKSELETKLQQFINGL